ncbi:MAG: branched-chain amino acid ABC transporter permease [Alicyclobacillus sp.]|nr:branched-chain amino acid ABC transporter permease [Alicyclobacillus sp.]
MLSSFLQILAGGILLGGIYVPVTVGLSELVGLSGIVNFAHGEMIMGGGYIGYILITWWHWPPVVAILVAGASMALLGSVTYISLLKRAVKMSHLYEHDQLVITLGVSILLQNIALILFTANYRTIQIHWLPDMRLGSVFIPGNALAGCAVGVLLGLGVIGFVQKTRWGKFMQACKQAADLAEYCGIRVDGMNALAFAISSGLAGVTGVFFASTVYLFPSVGASLLVTAFAIIVIGGLGNLGGALVASFIVGIVINLTEAYLPQGGTWGYAAPFLLLILILILRPQGLFGVEKA